MSDEQAELRELFGEELVDEAQVEEQSGEGESVAQSDSPSEKKTPSKATPEPETENQEEQEAGSNADEKDDRYKTLLAEVQRYKRFEPLLDILEEEPTLGRQILAGKLRSNLGIAGEAATPAAPVQPAPTAPSQEQINEYWQKRIEEDPASAVRDLIHVATQEATRGSKAASARVLTNDYKSRRRAEEPLFAQYEPYFDELSRQANQEFILNNPDATLTMVENIALGTWAREQRGKAAKAKMRPAPVRETPRSLEESKTSAPGKPAATKRRDVTPEEQALISIYGDEYANAVLADETESPWRR